ncbi:MAG: hypothetical protein WD208_02210 [Dehalococcoidia bacterium]
MNKELTRKRMNRKRAATVAMTMVASGTLIAGAIFAAPLWINPSIQVEPTQVVTPTPDTFAGLGSSLRSRPIPKYEASVSLAPPIIAGAPQAPDAPDPEEIHSAPGSLQVNLFPAERDAIERDPVLGGTATLSPTYSWVNAFSIESTLDGQPLPVGAVVAAYDPEGILTGRAVVQSEGKYGLMAIYMDDPSTPEDEGAVPGDQIRFEINGMPAVVLGPHSPAWSSNGAVLMLNLAANSRLTGAP